MSDMLNDGRVPDMSKLSVTDAKLIPLSELVKSLDKSEREKFLSGYDLKRFAKIFEDGSMMQTIDTFLDSGMNVSETARKLYMHRNTLTYRLNTIQRKTGLDIRNFDMAVTFKLLHCLYMLK